MPTTAPLDACGRRRSPATLSTFHPGRPPRNKGQRYPADPPTVEEIIAVMHAAGADSDSDAVRLRGLIIVLWRAGLRISEALALSESDLDLHRGAILVRRGKGGKRREVGMDRWAWEQLTPRLQIRATLPVDALFCVLRGPTAGRQWAPAGVRAQLHHAAAQAGVRRRFAPHQLRHAHAVEMSREGVALLVIQRQLGHADLAITSVYLRGIDNTETVHAVHERSAPMIPATLGRYIYVCPGGLSATPPGRTLARPLGLDIPAVGQRFVAAGVVRSANAEPSKSVVGRAGHRTLARGRKHTTRPRVGSQIGLRGQGSRGSTGVGPRKR